MAYMSKSPQLAASWFKIDNAGVVFISPCFFGFASNLIGKRFPRFTAFGILVAATFALLGLVRSYFFTKVKTFYWGPFPQFNLLHSIPFFVFWGGYSLASFNILRGETQKTGSAVKKNQLKFVILAFSIAYVGSVDYLATFGIEFYPFGFIPIFSLVTIIFYAIVKHRLMDFNLIMRWGIVYGISFSVIISSLCVMAFATEHLVKMRFQVASGIPTILLTCLGVLIFDPTKKKIFKFVDTVIFKSPDFHMLLTGVNQVLQKKEPIHPITAELSNHLKRIWDVNHAGFVIWSNSETRFLLYPEIEFRDEIINKLKAQIDQTDFLVRTLQSERRLFRYGIVVQDEVTALGNRASPGERITFWKIRRTMRWLGASACIPLSTSNQLIGFIVLGSKNNNSLYNNEDKKFLSHVAQIFSSTFKELILDQVGMTFSKPATQSPAN